MKKSFVIIFLNLINLYQLNAKMEPKIIGGSKANIKNYRHSAYFRLFCGSDIWGCGSSILNQRIILTAAHCLDCTYDSIDMAISYGNENRKQGIQMSALRWTVHSQYDESILCNDIALVLLKGNLNFNAKISRIAIMKKPPHEVNAHVAGWGQNNMDIQLPSLHLKHIEQKVWSRKKCSKIISHLPAGTICGGQLNSSNYIALGDSGSALVIRKYIQIGIVSFKRLDVSDSLVVYTDTAYYYNWIMKNSKKLYCSCKKKDCTNK